MYVTESSVSRIPGVLQIDDFHTCMIKPVVFNQCS